MERLTHIKRIFGKRKAATPGGEPVDAPDIYADMLRIDRMSVMEHPGAQEVVRSTKWKDKPDDPPGGNPTREMMTIRLIDPDDPNPDDPSAWIDLPVIRRMTTMRHPGAQETITSFHPSSAAVEPDSTARRVSVKRVTFAETNADATLDDTSYYADGSAYQRKADTVDTSQYLDVEVIESYPSTRHPGAQGVTVTMNNDLIKEMFADTPAGAPRGPVRLDPLQNLLNVCWGGGATEIPIGSRLSETLSVTDPQSLTIALWVYLEDLEQITQLIQFGPHLADETDHNDLLLSNVNIFNDQIGFVISGHKDSTMTVAPEDGGPGGGPYVATPYLSGATAHRARLGWNFFAVSIDASPGWTVSIALNTDIFPNIDADLSFTCAYRSLAAPDVLSFDDRPQNRNFEFALNDGELAIPRQSHYTNDDGYFYKVENVRLAAVQVWTGKFIDFSQSSICEKFVKADHDDPTKPLMVSPSVAQAAFGKPTFFFDGPPSKFAINRGSGGEFTKTGELKSFRPAPPKAPASG